MQNTSKIGAIAALYLIAACQDDNRVVNRPDTPNTSTPAAPTTSEEAPQGASPLPLEKEPTQNDPSATPELPAITGPTSVTGESAPPAEACKRNEAAADRARYVVVSHPNLIDSDTDGDFQVFTLSSAGTLASSPTHFTMGRAFDGRISFTNDGKIGLVVQEDGSVGVFSIDAAGSVSVIHARFNAGAWISSLVIAPDGETVYFLDEQWRVHGGGIYQSRIRCDGTLAPVVLVAEAKLPYTLLIRQDDGAGLVVARDVLTSTGDRDAHVISLANKPTLEASIDVFNDDDATIAGIAETADGAFALVGDANQFSSTGQRLAVLARTGVSYAVRQVITNVIDPIDIIASPFNRDALIISGFGNALLYAKFSAAVPSAPYSLTKLASTGSATKLPSIAAMIKRGPLSGRVLVPENVGIRQIQFQSQGAPTDLGKLSTGTGVAAIVGAIGIQP